MSHIPCGDITGYCGERSAPLWQPTTNPSIQLLDRAPRGIFAREWRNFLDSSDCAPNPIALLVPSAQVGGQQGLTLLKTSQLPSMKKKTLQLERNFSSIQ